MSKKAQSLGEPWGLGPSITVDVRDDDAFKEGYYKNDARSTVIVENLKHIHSTL